MNKKFKLLVVTSLVLGIFVTGCGGKTQETGSEKEAGTKVEQVGKEQEDGSGILTPTGTYPVVKEGEELTISLFGPLRAGVMSYDRDKNEFTKWVEDKTGLSLKFEAVPGTDRQAKLNVLMTSGNYPDVILDSYFSHSEQLLYGQQGVLIPLNDLIDQHGPNIKKALENNPAVLQNMTMEDGNIYSLPTIGTATHMKHPFKMWINKKWLDNLGLDIPETTEEFKEVLRAFKEDDPNGNGKADEIPLTGTLKGWNADPTLFLMNSFGYYDSNRSKSMYVENGEVKYSRSQDEFKEGLKYINSLYKEGLMDSLVYSQNVDQLKKVANQPGETIIGVCGGGSLGAFLNLGDSDRWRDYVALPPLKGPGGQQNAITLIDYGDPVLNITDACENPEAVIRLFDLMFTEEGFMGNISGVEGIDYVEAEAGAVNVLGEPARYTELTANAEREGRYWNQLGPWLRPDDFERWYSANPDGDMGTVLYNETVNKYMPYAVSVDNLLPPLGFNPEDSRELVDIELALSSYVDQAITDFIMGTKDIDKNWEAYIKQLEELGLPRYLEFYQKAYDNNK